MEMIIDDLLFLSRVETAPAKNFDAEVALDEVAARVRDSRDVAARRKRQEFSLEVARPFRVRGDATLLERLVANLVDNAVRYSPEGGRIERALIEDRGAAVVGYRRPCGHLLTRVPRICIL